MSLAPNEVLANLFATYAPLDKWFPEPGAKGIVADMYRVYKEPFADRVAFPSIIQIIDFDSAKARAVFIRAQVQIPDYERSHTLFPTPDGGTRTGPQESWVVLEHEEYMQSTEREIWHDTGDGIFLLILTPSLTGTGIDDPAKRISQAVEMTLELVRSSIILTMGRNAAFEQIFRAGVVVDPDQRLRKLEVLSTGRDHPDSYDEPQIDGFTAQESVQFVQDVLDAEDDVRNRISLALRWYLRAKRTPVPVGELRIDTFVYYWIAFEALAMPDGDHRSALQLLAARHGKTVDEIKAVFPIGRLQGLRSRILHRGELYPLDVGLSAFMDALCVDAMMHLIGTTTKPRTTVYLDGSGIDLLPKINKRYRLPEENE
jgi:hypothetical protein